jgi:phosphinothricin acetyltransferase
MTLEDFNMSETETLESRKNGGRNPVGVELRGVLPADATSLLEIYRPYIERTAISFETQPPSTEEFITRIGQVTQKFPWMVCQHGKRLVGYAYASQHRDRAAYRWSADVAVYVDQNHHRQGLGRHLYTSLIAELKRLGYFNAFAGITLPNEKSVGLHEAMGFRPIGVYKSVGYKLGKWHDVGWWQLRLKEYELSPKEPGVARL